MEHNSAVEIEVSWLTSRRSWTLWLGAAARSRVRCCRWLTMSSAGSGAAARARMVLDPEWIAAPGASDFLFVLDKALKELAAQALGSAVAQRSRKTRPPSIRDCERFSSGCGR